MSCFWPNTQGFARAPTFFFFNTLKYFIQSWIGCYSKLLIFVLKLCSLPSSSGPWNLRWDHPAWSSCYCRREDGGLPFREQLLNDYESMQFVVFIGRFLNAAWFLISFLPPPPFFQSAVMFVKAQHLYDLPKLQFFLIPYELRAFFWAFV